MSPRMVIVITAVEISISRNDLMASRQLRSYRDGVRVFHPAAREKHPRFFFLRTGNDVVTFAFLKRIRAGLSRELSAFEEATKLALRTVLQFSKCLQNPEAITIRIVRMN